MSGHSLTVPADKPRRYVLSNTIATVSSYVDMIMIIRVSMMSVEQPITITDTNSNDGVKDDFNCDDLKTLDNNQWLNDRVSKFLHQ